MFVDFKDIDFNQYGVESPTLTLYTMFGTKIAYIGTYLNLKFTLRYNSVSEMSFDVPEHFIENGEIFHVPYYKDLTGMKIVEAKPFGKFILRSPEITNDGIREMKSCTLYSLENELNDKKVFISGGTYNFYNPTASDDTILKIIKDTAPNWNIGDVDPDLLGKYRTFDDTDDNLYSFMMNTLQEAYGCLFLFDTNTRTIHVKSTNSKVEKSPVYLSFDNLVKEIDVTELTDEIVTCMSVYGADPVSIRSVNPMGNNMIYDISYYIENGDLPQEMCHKWQKWKAHFDAQQTFYSNLVVEYNIELANKAAESANLNKLKGDLMVLEQQQSAYASGYAGDVGYGEDAQEDMARVKREIAQKKEEIGYKEQELAEIAARLDAMTEDKKKINSSCAFSAFFTPEETKLLNLYFKEETLTESTFVISSVDYSNDNIARNLDGYSFHIQDTMINEIDMDPALNRRVFDFTSGTLSLTGSGNSIAGDIKNITLNIKKESNEFLLTCFLNNISESFKGKTSTYPSADLSIKGALSSFRSTEESLSFDISSSISFLQFGVTEYQQQQVERELYDYGVNVLSKLSHPSHEFSVKSANFIFTEAFKPFKDTLKLGNSIYLNMDNGNTLLPILLEVNLDYEDVCNFSMTFSDKFTLRDGASGLADLLGKTINTSRSVDFNKYNYSAYKNSGAENQVRNYMKSALDVAKNAITTSSGLDVCIDGSGIHMRKWNEDKTDYLPQQMRIIENAIVFTDDGWDTAQAAIGKFTDPNLGSCYGVVAPNIVGTLLAGENLVIENRSPSGKNVQFKVDGTGVYLNNARLLSSYGNTQIAIDPSVGFAIGKNPLYSVDDSTNELVLNEENANLYADKDGNLTLKGTVYAENGSFTGEVNARSGIFKGTIQANKYLDSQGREMRTNEKFKADYLDLKGLNINNNFIVDENGHVTINGGDISWGSVTGTDEIDNKITSAQNKADGAYNLADGVDGDLADMKYNIGYTKIGQDYVISPTIVGGYIRSNTNIDVKKNINLGDSLCINGYNFGASIDFNGTDGSNIARIDVDPVSKSLFLSSRSGKVFINGDEYSTYAKFA